MEQYVRNASAISSIAQRRIPEDGRRFSTSKAVKKTNYYMSKGGFKNIITSPEVR